MIFYQIEKFNGNFINGFIRIHSEFDGNISPREFKPRGETEEWLVMQIFEMTDINGFSLFDIFRKILHKYLFKIHLVNIQILEFSDTFWLKQQILMDFLYQKLSFCLLLPKGLCSIFFVYLFNLHQFLFMLNQRIDFTEIVNL